MLGELNELQIDNLLLSQTVGRIGYTDGDNPFITPVTYVYDGKYIIGQTREGLKVSIMRNNAKVCFQVDKMSDLSNWQSVVVSGKFQELKGEKAALARNYLCNHVMTLMTSAAIHPHEHEVNGVIDDSNRIKPIMYRIKIKEKKGRFEKQ